VSFKDIKGHDNAITCLKKSIAEDKVSHAYIFAGPSGIGKKLIAVNFAKALNCLGRGGDTGEACDSCASCRKIDSSGHPDVFIVKAEKEGSDLGIDKVRELIRNIGLKPYEAKKKVYIIDEAGSLTGEATNAFLKTLEAPPSESVIIFISKGPGELLPTIESRSQVIRFFALPLETTEDILKNALKIDSARAGILSHISSGSPGVALKMNENNFFEKRSFILDALASGSFFDSDLEKISRQEMKFYLDMILGWYRDVLVAKSAKGSGPYLINPDKAEAVSREAGRRDFSFLDDVIKQIILTRSLLDENVNTKLALGILSANINEG